MVLSLLCYRLLKWKERGRSRSCNRGSFDKITILDIKLERISMRIDYLLKEKDTLEKALNEESENQPFLYSELRDVNMKIWDTEAGFREKEAKQEFDDEFVEFARLNAKYNDERFLIKESMNSMSVK